MVNNVKPLNGYVTGIGNYFNNEDILEFESLFIGMISSRDL